MARSPLPLIEASVLLTHMETALDTSPSSGGLLSIRISAIHPCPYAGAAHSRPEKKGQTELIIRHDTLTMAELQESASSQMMIAGEEMPEHRNRIG
jgi:hypothetical protein